MEGVPYERTLLSKRVSKNLRDLIIIKQFKPGDKLPNEIDLSRMMGVSRSTIREAIKTLASSNVVEVMRGKGTYVCEQPGLIKDPLGIKFISDKNLLSSLFEARILIEPRVAYLAAERALKSDLKKIKESIDRMKDLIEIKKSYKNEDLDFHKTIAKATKNPIIQRLVPIINESIIQGYFETRDIPGSAQKAIKYHSLIFAAINNGDASGAQDMMQKHLEEALQDILFSNVMSDIEK
jgi:GntR family transcriptional regulator, transcriptional repressor for pyruvate dehydrogenase complex